MPDIAAIAQDTKTAADLVASLIEVLDRLDNNLYDAEYNSDDATIADAAYTAHREISETVLANANLSSLKSALADLTKAMP